MRRIDELHLNHPFAGARMLAKMLKREGQPVGRRRVSTLMKRMGIMRCTASPTPASGMVYPVYPYLLRNLAITRSNHVWAADITYIPMRRGFMYLFAVLDWASRRVLSWRLSNTLITDFCIEAVQEAMNRYGKPEIFNTDQGCQFTITGDLAGVVCQLSQMASCFTSLDFTGMLKDNGIQICMDGKGCWRDNVFVERLWRGVKYEEVYLYACDSVSDAKRGLEKYFRLYNQRRPHTSLDDKTPDEFYFNNLPALLKAA